jgi:hypothetical protein
VLAVLRVYCVGVGCVEGILYREVKKAVGSKLFLISGSF